MKRAVLLLILFLLAPWRLFAEEPAAAFDAANKLYAQGKFAEAVGAYQKILETGTTSPVIYFNLGNAFFKSGNIGQAVAAYRQAAQVSPRDPDVQANLQFARNQVTGPTFRPSRAQNWFGRLSLNEWSLLAAAAMWVTFGLLVLRQVRPALKPALRGFTLATGGATVVLALCLVCALTVNAPGSIVVVTAQTATIHNSPYEESPQAFTANDGAELRVVDQNYDWLQVTDGNKRVGWVKQSNVARLKS